MAFPSLGRLQSTILQRLHESNFLLPSANTLFQTSMGRICEKQRKGDKRRPLHDKSCAGTRSSVACEVVLSVPSLPFPPPSTEPSYELLRPDIDTQAGAVNHTQPKPLDHLSRHQGRTCHNPRDYLERRLARPGDQAYARHQLGSTHAWSLQKPYNHHTLACGRRNAKTTDQMRS